MITDTLDEVVEQHWAHLKAAARVRCEAALATRSLAQLPSVVDIMALVFQTAHPTQAVKCPLSGDMPSTRQDVDSQAGANSNGVA